MLKISYDGKTYELAYNRETVKRMDKAGFSLQKLVEGDEPLAQRKMLFDGAFLAKENPKKRIKGKLCDEIWDSLDDKAGLLSELIDMYMETYETLTDKAAEDSEKNATWERT